MKNLIISALLLAAIASQAQTKKDSVSSILFNVHKDSLTFATSSSQITSGFRISEVEYNFLVIDTKKLNCILCNKPLGLGEIGLFANKHNSSGQLCVNLAHGRCIKPHRE